MYKGVPYICEVHFKSTSKTQFSQTGALLLTLRRLKCLPAEQELHTPSGKVQQTLRTLWLCCLGFRICNDGFIQWMLLFMFIRFIIDVKAEIVRFLPLKQPSQDVKGPLLALPPRQLRPLIFIYLHRLLRTHTHKNVGTVSLWRTEMSRSLKMNSL